MKYFFCFFCFTYSLFLAQNKRFIYDYLHSYTNDSLNVTKNTMYLDIYKEGSLFFDAKYQKDSVNFHGYIEYSVNSTNINDIVLKSYPNYSINWISKIDQYYYKINDKRTLKWVLLNEKENIGEIETQKATVSFGGRNWIAWFSKDIPIQDGPYKFCGLPGMIIKIEDDSRTHSFTLREIIENPNKKLIFTQKTISINYEKYKKLYNENRNNPLKKMIQNGVKVSETSDASEDMEFIKNMQNYYKNQQKNNYNIIELDLIENK
ncbi:MAG: GLPGLI family protein [Bergeyella sp.]